ADPCAADLPLLRDRLNPHAVGFRDQSRGVAAEPSALRKIFANPALFTVVQDAFMTETAQFADVVLPTALWGEKTGCFTNADRTVHISHKAIEPPGEAKSDFEIFLDFARRMDFRDKDEAL